MISLKESFKLIKKYKLPIVKTFASLDFEKLRKSFLKMKKPIVLKVYSPDIIHKTDVGCLITGINNLSQLREAYKKILKNVFSFNPNARIESFLMQESAKGVELIIGTKIDETFGKIILFGLGGIYTEVFEDIAIRVLPINENQADSMIKQIKGFKILSSYRGKRYNLGALKELILKVAKLFENENIKEVDLNPVFLDEKEAKIVDWKFYR
jgi:succinyl-CoA synthetase beta subunit